MSCAGPTGARPGTWHVIGAGLAGLAAATAAAARSNRVILWEATGAAGGRCRSLADKHLGHTIDNGNHLILSGNRATLAYLDRIGGRERMAEVRPAAFPFVDLKTGARWTLRPGEGPIPWWLLNAARRPPGVTLPALAKGARRVLFGRAGGTGGGLEADLAFERFWGPLITAVLNTDPAEADLGLLRPVLLETLGRGERWCRPLIAKTGLGDALVEPAVTSLNALGATCRFGSRVEALGFKDDRVEALQVAGETMSLAPEDRVVVATPAWTAATLVPGLDSPERYGPIVNAHFAVAGGNGAVPSLLGLIGGTAEWIFRRAEIVSVTVSAADGLVDRDAAEIARLVWRDVCRALDFGDRPLPPFRIVKEKRATPWQTPAEAARRWTTATRWCNLALAGDWIATGLPATIESAVRSGDAAVSLLAEGRAA